MISNRDDRSVFRPVIFGSSSSVAIRDVDLILSGRSCRLLWGLSGPFTCEVFAGDVLSPVFLVIQ